MITIGRFQSNLSSQDLAGFSVADALQAVGIRLENYEEVRVNGQRVSMSTILTENDRVVIFKQQNAA